jgi:hypothetical protein
MGVDGYCNEVGVVENFVFEITKCGFGKFGVNYMGFVGSYKGKRWF